MLSKSRAPGTVPHRLRVYGSFRQVHGVSGHVTLHFEFQLHILEVRHSLSSLYYILLVLMSDRYKPEALPRISQQSRVNVIAGTSFYVDSFIPEDVKLLSVEEVNLFFCSKVNN